MEPRNIFPQEPRRQSTVDPASLPSDNYVNPGITLLYWLMAIALFGYGIWGVALFMLLSRGEASGSDLYRFLLKGAASLALILYIESRMKTRKLF